MKIDWKQKLSSRKLWMAVSGVIGGIVLLSQGEIETGVALMGSSILGYLVAEGIIDSKRASSAAIVVEQVADGLANAFEEANTPANQEGTDD